jgi:hypothetical protein
VPFDPSSLDFRQWPDIRRTIPNFSISHPSRGIGRLSRSI